MKTIQEVRKLCERAISLPHEIPDFETQQSPLGEENTSRHAQDLLAFFAPVLDAVNWEARNGMNPVFQKSFERTAKVAACHAMANRLKIGARRLQREATTAGVDLPTFTRQLLLTITRSYAKLFALQLFGLLPLTGPTGRLLFKDFQYDSAFTGSTPYINPGDRTDDITKFNPDYYAAPEGVQANKIKLHYSNMDIATSDYRVVSDWTDQAQDDAQSVYDDDIDSSNMNHMTQESSRVMDRRMITALINAVPAANKYSWTASPTSNPAYATLSPSEKQAYDELLYRDAINTTINKINVTRKYNGDGDPRWVICGTTFALRLNKLTFFKPVNINMTEMELQRGALRDLGVMENVGLRFLVDPMLGTSISGGADMAFFGRKPVERGDVGLYLCPYVMLQPTRDHYDPDTGTTTKAVRNRFGICQPNTATNPASSQLGEVYGQLTVTSGGTGV